MCCIGGVRICHSAPLGGSVKKRGITLVQTGNNRKWDKNNLQTKLSCNSHFSCNDMPCIGCPFCMGKGNLDKKFFWISLSVKTRKSHLFSFSTMAEAHLLSGAQPNWFCGCALEKQFVSGHVFAVWNCARRYYMRKQKRQLQEYREFFSGLLQCV